MKYDIQVDCSTLFENIEANSREEAIDIAYDKLSSMGAIDLDCDFEVQWCETDDEYYGEDEEDEKN